VEAIFDFYDNQGRSPMPTEQATLYDL